MAELLAQVDGLLGRGVEDFNRRLRNAGIPLVGTAGPG